MSNSLIWAGLELLGGPDGTYNVVDEAGDFGDPQKIAAIIRSQLTSGSFETGSLSDNRQMSFQILVTAGTRLGLSQACSALLAVANTANPQILTWTPDGCPATVFDTFRGQPTTLWSGKYEAAHARVIQVDFAALPFGRSDTKRVVTGSSGSTTLLDFSTPVSYTTVASGIPSLNGKDPRFYDSLPTPDTDGTDYDAQDLPASLPGAPSACMRVDANLYRYGFSSPYIYYNHVARIAVDVDDGDWSSYHQLVLSVYVGTSGNTISYYDTVAAWLTLTDSSGASQHWNMWAAPPGFDGAYSASPGWMFPSTSLADATIDLTDITSARLDIYHTDTVYTHNTNGYNSYFLTTLDGYPAGAATATTSRGAVYKLSSVLGDATADAAVAFDRGGTDTISGFLVHKAPASSTGLAPSLIGITSNAGTADAPALFNGTYRVIMANGGSTITAGTLTVTQKIGATTVATATVSVAQVTGATKWGDGGDLTLPLVDVPGDASGDVNYSFSYTQTATDLILADTSGFLCWVPTLSSAVKYVWVDAATAAGAGGVFGGNSDDRTDATSLLGQTQVQTSGTPSLDPGDNYLLLFCLDGAPSDVTVSYYDRYLGERTAA